MSQLISANDSNFDQTVLAASRPVLVDFSATWCGPCKKLKPVVEELAGEYHGRVDVVHVDIDEARETATKFGIMSVPTLLLFKSGEIAEKITGLVPKEKLQKQLDQLLA